MGESDIPVWVQVLIAAGVPLLVPMVAWFLDQRGVARRTVEFDALLKRAELVHKLQTLNGTPNRTDTADRTSLDNEVEDILRDLEALREAETTAQLDDAVKQSRWRRAFLFYKQASLKGAIYRAFFYIFSVFTVAIVFGTLLESSVSGNVEEVFIILLGAAFYLGIALLFRWGAVRDYDRKLVKHRAKRA